MAAASYLRELAQSGPARAIAQQLPLLTPPNALLQRWAATAPGPLPAVAPIPARTIPAAAVGLSEPAATTSQTAPTGAPISPAPAAAQADSPGLPLSVKPEAAVQRGSALTPEANSPSAERVTAAPDRAAIDRGQPSASGSVVFRNRGAATAPSPRASFGPIVPPRNAAEVQKIRSTQAQGEPSDAAVPGPTPNRPTRAPAPLPASRPEVIHVDAPPIKTELAPEQPRRGDDTSPVPLRFASMSSPARSVMPHARQEASEPGIHIGTLEIRVAPPPPSGPAPRRAAPAWPAGRTMLSRGFVSSFGLKEG